MLAALASAAAALDEAHLALTNGRGHFVTALGLAHGPAAFESHETELMTDLALCERIHHSTARKLALDPVAASAVPATPEFAAVNGFGVAGTDQCWAPAVHAADAAAAGHSAAAADVASAAA